MSQTFTIRVKRGLKANLPASAALGELIFTTDTKELYCGAGLSNPLDFVSGPQTVGPVSSFSTQPSSAPYSVPATIGPFTLSAVGQASGGTVYYTGSITGISTYSSLVGCAFIISGFTNPANNGTFTCYGASSTLLLLANASAVAETHAGTATNVPTNANVSSGSGCFGFSFQVSEPITVSQLGRQYIAGNTQNHNVKLWANTNTGTPLASGTVLAASASDAFGIKWASISPVTLTPGVRYSIAIDENISGDEWPDILGQFYLQPQFPVSVNTPSGVCPNICAMTGAAGAFPGTQAPVGDNNGIGSMYDAPAMMYTYTEGD